MGICIDWANLGKRSAIASCVVALSFGMPALGQSATGTLFVNVSCGGSSRTHNFSAVDRGSLSQDSQCFDQFGGPGLASTNNAGGSWAIADGALDFDFSSSSDFVFIGNNQGGGSASLNFVLNANDLIFTNIAHPAQTGTITVSGMHYRFGGQATTQGVSNCSVSNPRANIFFEFNAGACNGFGGFVLDRQFSGGSIIQGAMLGYPNDGSMVDALSTGGATSLALPYSTSLHAVIESSVLDCNGLPTGVGAAHASLRWQFPCGTPVFDLPPGYTVNSAQLHIVNNRWLSPFCCIADVDDGTGTGTPDGGVTIDDLLYYLFIFEQGALAADVDDGTSTGTPDGGVTIDDLLYYLQRFEAGC